MDLVKTITHISNVDNLMLIQDSLQGVECNTYAKAKDGKYIGCNDNTARTIGLPSGKCVIGQTDFDLLPEPQFLLCSNNDNQVMYSDQLKIFMEPFFSVDNTPMMATSIKMPLRNKMKKVIGIVGLSIIQQHFTLKQEMTNEYKLTARQLNCLLYLTKGRSMKLIAEQLGLSPRTVEHYLTAARDKMSCNNRVEMIDKALLIPYIKNRL